MDFVLLDKSKTFDDILAQEYWLHGKNMDVLRFEFSALRVTAGLLQV